jgi:hypothetical protein
MIFLGTYILIVLLHCVVLSTLLSIIFTHISIIDKNYIQHIYISHFNVIINFTSTLYYY